MTGTRLHLGGQIPIANASITRQQRRLRWCAFFCCAPYRHCYLSLSAAHRMPINPKPIRSLKTHRADPHQGGQRASTQKTHPNVSRYNSGFLPPLAHSNNSAVCTTGRLEYNPICWMQPMLAEAMISQPVSSMASALSRPNWVAIWGCNKL